MSILIALDSMDGSRIPIGTYDPDKHRDRIVCQLGHPLVAKRGNTNIHHYAHAPGQECSLHYCNKGPWHHSMQEMIGQDHIEVPFKGEDGRVVHIADALCGNTVIEFQKSYMPEGEMKEREAFYTGKGYALCWVFCCTRDESKVDISCLERYKDLLICQWSSGPSYPLKSRCETYLDPGGYDMLKIEYIRGKRFVARIVRFGEWLDTVVTKVCINPAPSQNKWKRYDTEPMDRGRERATQSEVKAIQKKC